MPKIPKKQTADASDGPTLEALEAELERRRNLIPVGLAEAVVTRVPSVSAGLESLDRRRVEVGTRLSIPPIHGDLRFGFPFLSWDAWMVLHHIAREPLEHNQDGTIPARWIKPLEGRFVPLPEWGGIGAAAANRVAPALQVLLDLGLLATRRGPKPESPNLRIGVEGAKALKAGRAAFFARTLEFKWLGAFDPALERMRQVSWNRIGNWVWRMGHEAAAFEGLARRLSARVLGVLPANGSARWTDMDDAFGPTDSVVFERGVPWSERKAEVAPETFFDRIDGATASGLLADALMYPYAFGLIARGVTSDGEVTWSLTGPGRAWLGLPAHREPDPPRHVKVTPAFDVYFGRAEPESLAELSLYAELTRHDHGVVGRLVARSVQGATALGIAVTEIVASLERMVGSPIPANVRIALDDWGRAAQPVVVREGVVLRCPDAATAATLERLGKGAAERLSETILLLADRRALTTLRKKAGEAGVIL